MSVSAAIVATTMRALHYGAAYDDDHRKQKVQFTTRRRSTLRRLLTEGIKA